MVRWLGWAAFAALGWVACDAGPPGPRGVELEQRKTPGQKSDQPGDMGTIPILTVDPWETSTVFPVTAISGKAPPKSLLVYTTPLEGKKTKQLGNLGAFCIEVDLQPGQNQIVLEVDVEGNRSRQVVVDILQQGTPPVTATAPAVPAPAPAPPAAPSLRNMALNQKVVLHGLQVGTGIAEFATDGKPETEVMLNNVSWWDEYVNEFMWPYGRTQKFIQVPLAVSSQITQIILDAPDACLGIGAWVFISDEPMRPLLVSDENTPKLDFVEGGELKKGQNGWIQVSNYGTQGVLKNLRTFDLPSRPTAREVLLWTDAAGCSGVFQSALGISEIQVMGYQVPASPEAGPTPPVEYPSCR